MSDSLTLTGKFGDGLVAVWGGTTKRCHRSRDLDKASWYYKEKGGKLEPAEEGLFLNCIEDVGKTHRSENL